ncbi:MAG: hypothetical protein ACT4P7_13310 [Gemmatimonadaceae bacterium]
MRLRRFVSLVGLGGLTLVTTGHVGSPDTFFQGMAGPWPIRATVRLPGVIPGLAQIDIAVTGEGVDRVSAQPVVFGAGKGGAPPPDVATPVPGRPGEYHAELWFMQQGSFGVTIEVTGRAGSGVVIVPVAAVAVSQIPLHPWLGKLLVVLGVLLFAGAVTIFRAAGADGVTAPGQPVTVRGRRLGRVAASVGAVVLALSLVGARNWWNAVERDYVANLYRPFAAAATTDTTGGRRSLRFVIADSAWQSRRAGTRWERFSIRPLIPDHGKLMHLFLIRKDDAGALGHLHPISSDSSTFRTALGNLPAGTYRAFADVVHETGFAQTMTAEVEVPAAAGDTARADSDDAIFVGLPGEATMRLPDGASVTWENRPASLRANEDARLTFVVREADGSTARLAPYLGMPGHAVVYRTDGQVYIHLHPNGTISTAAQQALGTALVTDSLPGVVAGRLAAHTVMTHAGTEPRFDGRLTFPYAFPGPGTYRLWVQVRRGETIATAPFAITVQ